MANLIRRGGGEGRDVARERSNESLWDPFRMMDAMLRWDPIRGGLGRGELNPSVDVKETKDAYVFKADLPGVREQDVQVQVTGSVLTISGEKTEETAREEGERYHTTERFYGSFARSFTLPSGADLEAVKAELKDGVLEVTVPKRPEVQPKRINIGSGSGGGAKSGQAKA
jgi:HSP20 family protein